MTSRKIIHIDMDAFFASVEQRDFPEYRGKPLAVGGSPDRRGVIAAASYEARKYGVRSAMPSSRAVRLCPDLILVRGRYDAYKEVSMQIRDIFAEYTALIEPLSIDEAYLDVTENFAGIPSATAIAQEIKSKIRERTGLTASAGVSYNKFLAKVASDYRKPDGLFVIPPKAAEAFIADLPIDAFYGIGAKTAPRLKAEGFHTGQDIQRLTEEQLKPFFGRSTGFYYQLARGIDERPVETEWIRKSIGSEKTFIRDLNQLEDMYVELAELADEIVEWMDRNESYGRTLTLKVKYDNFQQITRSHTASHWLKTQDDLLALARQLLQTTEATHRPVRLLGLSVAKLDCTEKVVEVSHPEDEECLQLHLHLI